MNDRTVNILFCGTGGQGVLKAAEVCGWAAMFAGLHAKKSEVHGMAQRGGSVESHLRFGKKVFSPLIPKGRVDVLCRSIPVKKNACAIFWPLTGKTCTRTWSRHTKRTSIAFI